MAAAYCRAPARLAQGLRSPAAILIGQAAAQAGFQMAITDRFSVHVLSFAQAVKLRAAALLAAQAAATPAAMQTAALAAAAAVTDVALPLAAAAAADIAAAAQAQKAAQAVALQAAAADRTTEVPFR